MIKLDNDWDILLKEEQDKEYFKDLQEFINQEYLNYTVYPDKNSILKSLKLTSYKDTKVVIIGQDPYHEEGQANGLAFSVNDGVKLPPSLKNIYKEIESDIGIKMGCSGDLTSWAKQGVLLLNNCLTVRSGLANSHKGKGWEEFTNKIVSLLNDRSDPVIFVFWGNNAKEKMRLVTNKIHLVLTSAHPSPLSAYNGFFGCKHFSKINDYLLRNNKKTIDWQI